MAPATINIPPSFREEGERDQKLSARDELIKTEAAAEQKELTSPRLALRFSREEVVVADAGFTTSGSLAATMPMDKARPGLAQFGYHSEGNCVLSMWTGFH